jgi:hypothetical protein
MTANLAYMPVRDERLFRTQSTPASPTGKKLHQMWLQAASHARDNATDWRSLTKALIEEVAIECKESNWDGYGASPISEAAKYQAQALVDLLPYRFPAPEAVPDADGEIALSWDFGPGYLFTLSINESGRLSYAGLLGQGAKRHGMEPFKGDIPKIIIDSIDELSERALAIAR